jgi:hypothetical protein
MMRRMLGLVWMLAIALFASGCGGAAYEARSAGAPGAPGYAMDSDGDAIADSDDAAPGPEMSVHRSEMAPPPPPEPGPMAQAPPATGGRPPVKERPSPDTAVQPAPDAPTVDTGATKQVAAPLLIYTANIHLAVFEARKAIDEAEKLAKDAGGYLVRRNDKSITVRVPAGKFDGALAQMLKLGDVLHREVSVQDVTAEYHDLAVRLKNAEAVRDRLEELLKKAANVSDAIQVERELARVTADVESMKGRLKLLRELVSFSTITLRFQARAVDTIDSKVQLPFPWLHQLGLSNLLRL